MPNLENGFTTAITTMLIGGILTAMIASMMPELLPFFNILAIIGLITMFENANYWGINYTLGWLIAYLFVGRAFIGVAEFSLSLGIFGLYILNKLLNKYG